jgi:hypothetical protein
LQDKLPVVPVKIVSEAMAETNDPNFPQRVEAILDVCNVQVTSQPNAHLVVASTAFAAARFAVWITATTTLTVDELRARRQVTVDAFTEGFRQMLDQHFDDIEQNYTQYLDHQPGVVTR